MIKKQDIEKYCKDYWNIENYDAAMADYENTWHCHHRRETDENKTMEQLIEEGLYWDRPSEELIFMTECEHKRLHGKGKVFSEESKKKISESMKGKHHSEESKKKMSEARKGEKNHNFGKTQSEETKKKISEAKKGKQPTEETRKKMSEAHKGKVFTEGHKKKMSENYVGNRGMKWKLVHGKRVYYKEENNEVA